MLKKGSGDVRSGGTGCSCKGNRRGSRFGGEEDGGDIGVEGEGFAPSTDICQTIDGFSTALDWKLELPVDGFGVVVFGFQGWCNMGVNPKGPESVIEVEGYYLG